MKRINVMDTDIKTMVVNGIDYVSITDIARRKNPDFKGVEFAPFLKEAGSNAFTMSPSRWIEKTGAIGLISKINYHIHTDAIKQNLIPAALTKQQMSIAYANKADVLNMALFGFTAKDWRDTHLNLQGNVRDYATVNQLLK